MALIAAARKQVGQMIGQGLNRTVMEEHAAERSEEALVRRPLLSWPNKAVATWARKFSTVASSRL